MSVVAGRMTRMTTPAAVIMDAVAYAQAVEDAVTASAAYYAGGTSALDDNAYDRLVRGIAAWEADHPDQVLPGCVGLKRVLAQILGSHCGG
jgi:DNA ligase (NAD+)